MHTQPLHITSRRGQRIAALLDTPGTPGSHPLVILLHGRPGWKEEEHLASLAQSLAEHGIAALRFDAPGSGESEGTWADDYRVSTYIDALADIHNYALANLPVGPKNVGLWSHAGGGLIALRAMNTQLRDIAAFCICEPSTGQGITNPRVLEAWKHSGWRAEETEHFGTVRFPYEYHTDRTEQSARTDITSIHAPLLIISGTNDVNVSAEDIRTLFEQANMPKEYHEFPMDHFYKYNPEMLSKVNMLTVRFFKRELQRTT